MFPASQVRTYDPAASIVFLKTKERFGGLSNMAAGFPLWVNGIQIRTSEALYQACRFPHMPDVQRRIIDERSPMTAKMRSKPFRKDSRPDWDAVRVKIMRWCLRVKLAQNWKEFRRLLLESGQRAIVEQSRKDDFWGAKVAENGSLVGMNVLGRLLMELREQLNGDEAENLRAAEPLSIPEFLLFQKPIEMVCADEASIRPVGIEIRPVPPAAPPPPSEVRQPSLFDQSMIARGPIEIQNNRTAEAKNNKNPKPYSVYRDSGLPWLGDVPEHWVVQRGKALLASVDTRSTTGDEELLTVSAERGVVPREAANVTMFKAESYVGYKLCWPGDLVINSLWAWAHGLGVSLHHGIVSSAYGVYRPLPRVNARFIHLLARSIPFQWELQVRSKGIWVSRLQLTDAAFLGAPFPLPPLPEQAAIVRYLDHVDRRIRRYVTAKRKLLALLEEERQAVTNRAVTRGLGPNVPLKPSGVLWLGDVPEHWEVSRVKTEFLSMNHRRVPLSAVERGVMTGRQYDYYGASGVIDRVDDYLFDDDLLLIAEDGANLVLRNLPLAIIARGKFWVNNHAHILKPRRGNLEYLSAVMEGLDYTPWISGAAQPKLTQDRLMSIAIAVPPRSEQDEIICRVTEQTSSLRHTIVRARRQIELLQEYRTRLIADVVTGKLDAREAAAQLPDETDDQDPLEESCPLTDGMNEALYDIDVSVEQPAMESEVTA